jgi:uncharacterized protein involved in exopolysaccharide biosynthesis
VIPGKQYTPELILQIAWRRKWLIIVPAVVIITGVVTWTRQLKDVYKSDALIQIVPPRVPQNLVQGSSRSASTERTSVEARVRTISQQVLSRSHLEKIIEDFGLYPQARKTGIMEDVVEAMRSNIEGPTIKGPTFGLGFMHENPRTAMRVAERLASMYIDESLRDREVLAEGTSQFLEAQVEDARRQLVDNERRLQEYGRRHNGELPTQLQANLQGLQNTEMQLQSLEQSVNRDRDRHLLLERMIADAQAGLDVPTVPQAPRAAAATASNDGADVLNFLVAPRMTPSMLGGGASGSGGKGGGSGSGGGGKGGGGGRGVSPIAGVGGGGVGGSDGKGGGGGANQKSDDANAGKDSRPAEDAGKGGSGRPGSRPATAADQLRAARAALQSLELRLTPEHPDVMRARRAIAELQERAEAEAAERGLGSDTDPAEAARRNKMTEMQAEIARLDKQIADKATAQAKLRELQGVYQQHIEVTPTRETELTELTRDYGTLRSTYTNLLQKRLDAQVAANLERRQIGETFRLVDSARLPTQPYSPNRPRMYLMGVAGGIGFGLLLAFLLEYFDRTMRSEADVRAALNIPVLAAIPMIDVRSRRRRRMTPRDLPGAAAMLAVASAIVWRVMR